MGFFAGVKKVVKPFVDVRTWSDTDQNVERGKTILETVKGLVTPRKAQYQETFEQAVARMNLTEADLVRRAKEFLFLIVLE